MGAASDMEYGQPPTDNEITEYVKQFLESSDLQKITMKDVYNKVFSHYPNFDLLHKKLFIKTTVKLMIITETATADEENLTKSLQTLQLSPQSPLEKNPEILTAAGRNNGFALEETLVESLKVLELSPNSSVDENAEIPAELEEVVDRTPQYHQSEGASSDMKHKQPPTDDEIKEFVKQILEDADLEKITMRDVCNLVFGHYPDFDLAHKKDFIKATVKLLL